MTVTSAPAPSPLPVPRSGARPWLGLAVLILPTLVVAVDINAVFLAMPRLSLALHASATEQLWIADGYGFIFKMPRRRSARYARPLWRWQAPPVAGKRGR